MAKASASLALRSEKLVTNSAKVVGSWPSLGALDSELSEASSHHGVCDNLLMI